MDILVITSSLFLIPINLASINQLYLLMNHMIFLTLTSWAHHSILHINNNYTNNIYDKLDKIACYSIILHSSIFALYYNIKLKNN